jgi:general secretion pathway protein L
MSSIYLFLSSDQATQADWVIVSGNEVEHTVVDGELSQLQVGALDAVQVVIPGSEALITQAQLPKMSRFRLQQALPFALEEEVLDDLETLHFAHGPQVDNHVSVVVIRKARLEAYLQLLKGYGITPESVQVAPLALLPVENQWQLMTWPKGAASVRTGMHSGFHAELDSLETLLSLRLQEDLEPPAQLLCFTSETPQALQDVKMPLEKIQLSSIQLLEKIAQEWSQHQQLNLLSGGFSAQQKRSVRAQNKRVWQLAGVALSVWIAVMLLSTVGSYTILSLKAQHLRHTAANIYHRHLDNPGSNPRAKLEAKLRSSLAQGDQSRFSQLLAALAKSSSSIRIQELGYQNGALTLAVNASSFPNLEKFVEAMRMQGIEVKQQAAVLNGTQISAQLIVEGQRR